MRVLLARTAWGCGWLLAALVYAVPIPASAQGWGGSLGVVSDYVYRGLTQSNNEPSGQADLHYYGRSGWFAGLSAASVKRDPWSSTTAEFDPYLGWQWTLTEDWSSRVAAVHHDYPWNNPGHTYNYEEFSGTLGYAGRAFLTVAASPDTSVDGPGYNATGRFALAYDFTLHQPLPYAFSLDGGVGYYDLRWAVSTGYVYWNAGIGRDLGQFQLDLSYLGTSNTARQLYYQGVAVRRLVAAALWHF
jgi:uncharacterized protein (TIGR02001 family)